MNARRATDTIDAARRLQRALYRAAKASPTRRFHALYDKVFRADILARAWGEVWANGGAAGVDGQTIKEVERRGVAGFLAELGAELQEGRYRPRPVRRVWIPKADGSQRPLVVEGALDPGIHFTSADAAAQGNNGQPGASSGGGGSGGWSCPIVFLPDGTTQPDVRIAFGGAAGRPLVLRITAATGACSTSE